MIVDDLKIKILQLDSEWENPANNRFKAEKMLSLSTEKADVILLPEMFSTGFTMNTLLAETMEGETVSWLRNMAVSKNASIAGSILISENGEIFNRLVWCDPQNNIYTYDKRHLFRMGDEHLYFSPGKALTTISYKGWKIRPFICYDLRFPVWSRNVDNSFDVMIYFSNWPAVRNEAFQTLLKARAIENQCYVVGINRTGIDGNRVNYIGGSTVIDPKGKCLLSPLPEGEKTESISLNYNELVDFKTKFPSWKDMDRFRIIVD